MYSRLLLLLVVLTTAGCDVASSRLSFSTDATAYRPGSLLRLTLANQRNGEIWQNLCMSDFERHTEANGWTPWRGVYPPGFPSGGWDCRSKLFELASDSSAFYMLQIADTLSAGRYRFSTTVAYGRQSREITTAAFTVAR